MSIWISLKMTREYGLSNNVHFAGQQADIYGYLKRSKVFIMTSEAEGLPMAMIEALSCGVPCIMPDDSDINTVAIHEMNSLVVPVGDVEAFAESIKRLLTDETLYNLWQAMLSSFARRRQRNIQAAFDVNIRGTFNVLEACRNSDWFTLHRHLFMETHSKYP